MLERLRSDLTDAVRALLATPVTTFATVLLLAVAVGANLAVFGLVDRAILTPTRHVARPDRLFTLAFEVPNDATRGTGMTSTSYVVFDTLREHTPSIAGIAAWRRTATTVVLSGEQTRAEAMLVSGSYFAVLGAVPQLGRAIATADDHVASAGAVISHAFWRSAFGGDPGVLGRRVTVNRIDFVVSGVMPAGFSGQSATRVDIWVPLAAAMRDTPGWNLDGFRNIVSIIARVEPGAEVAAAAQASAALERRVSLVGLEGGEVAPTGLIGPIRRAVLDGRTDLPFVDVRPYSALLERQMRPWRMGTALLSLFGGLAMGVAGLGLYAVFTHAIAERRREMAIRIAVGAQPGRVLAMILREAGRLAVVGVLSGCALAVIAGRWLESMLVGTAPSDPVVLGAAAIVMLCVAGLATFVPARTASRADPTALLRAE